MQAGGTYVGKNGSGKKLEILIMSERRQSGIREPRTWEAVVRKFNISKLGRLRVMTKSRNLSVITNRKGKGGRSTQLQDVG